ncbi:hypothetical protein NC651_016584 [Populus alba x Populus x berolinensis]|nr:hypothetical protein NC651_016584 [Populus alba x Populus x berolinensis]
MPKNEVFNSIALKKWCSLCLDQQLSVISISMAFAHYLVAIPTEPSNLTKAALFSTSLLPPSSSTSSHPTFF